MLGNIDTITIIKHGNNPSFLVNGDRYLRHRVRIRITTRDPLLNPDEMISTIDQRFIK
jgi:hypothetical protein